jgi:Tol biopolymer transport system component
MNYPALSPDGRRIAVSSAEGGTLDIWVHDLTRSTKTRLTFDAGSERTPAWSPSGDEIVYWLAVTDHSSLLRRAADGTGEAVVLVKAKDSLPRPDWSRDGRYLVYSELNADGNFDIRYLQFAPDGAVSEPVTFLGTPAQESAPMLSPDGRFLAYSSDESGRPETYVRPFPGGDGKWQASVDGGTAPRWSRDGRELYYVQDNTTLMSVSVSTAQGATLGQPRMLFQSDVLASGVTAPTYDVSADGQRFVTSAPLDEIQPGASEQSEPEPPKIRIVENWYEEFRNRQE